MMCQEELLARQILAHHSKSFALAGGLLPTWCRQDATALYAWCRRCDDAVDLPRDPAAQSGAVQTLWAELGDVYGPRRLTDPILGGFQSVVRRHAIPRRYADDLIAGMAMDIGIVRYRTVDDLLLYCYRVAGTVGLMMAHIMKVRSPEALRRATDLGIAMQLTNICRDVAEDQRRGRVYLPDELLHGDRDGAAEKDAGAESDARGSARAVAALLRRAEMFYQSGDLGMAQLPFRCAIAIRAARLIYSDIGSVIARRGFDVRAGRAVVSRSRKLWLALRAAVETTPAFVLRKLWSRRAGSARLRGREHVQGQAPGPAPAQAPAQAPVKAPVNEPRRHPQPPPLPFALPIPMPIPMQTTASVGMPIGNMVANDNGIANDTTVGASAPGAWP